MAFKAETRLNPLFWFGSKYWTKCWWIPTHNRWMCTMVNPFTHARSSLAHCVKPPLTADGSDWLPLGDVDRSSRLTSIHPGLSQPPDWMGLSHSSSSYLLKRNFFSPSLEVLQRLQWGFKHSSDKLKKNVQPGSTFDAVFLSSLSQELQTFFNWFIFVFQMKHFGLLFFEAWLLNSAPPV